MRAFPMDFTPACRKAAVLIVVASMAVHTGNAEAASFALPEYSVRDLGQAQAGGAALAEDASTIFANPAGLTRLTAPQLVVGAIGLGIQSDFTDKGSRTVLGTPQTGTNDDDYIRNGLVPDIFLAMPVSDRMTVGVGITAPFGIDIEYSGNWLGRYQALNSKLITVDINPSVGIKLSEWASLGFGISAQYADASLSNAIDFGAVCLANIDPVAPGTCAATGVLPGAADGYGKVKGNDWSVGWNIGLLFDLDAHTRLGLHYRSRIDHEVEGPGTFQVPANTAALIPLLGGAFTNSEITSGIDLPATFTVSLHHEATDRLDVMGSVTLTQWQTFQGVRVDYTGPGQPDLVDTLSYKNAFRAALGAAYHVTPALTVRAGFAYDESPGRRNVQSAHLPDNDRIVIATGLSWSPLPHLALDAAYQYVHLRTLDFDHTGTFGDRLRGDFEASAHILGVGASIHF